MPKVFAGYYARMEDDSSQSLMQLVTAIERACLICSPESEQIMRRSVPIVSTEDLDLDALGLCIHQLRKSAKDDVQNVKNESSEHAHTKHKQK